MTFVNSADAEMLRRDAALWQQRRSGAELNRARGAYRNPYARDRARVLHCGSFRRMQGKYLLPGLDQGDLMRTRMTQAMEVAQLSRGLVRALEGLYSMDAPWRGLVSDPNLVEAIAFARFLGAPALGAGGELALQRWMADAGGFHTSAQSFHCLVQLEAYLEGFGLDLSRRMLLGCLSHPSAWHLVMPGGDAMAEGAYYDVDADMVDWVVQGFEPAEGAQFLTPAVPAVAPLAGKAGSPSWDGSIVSLAVDIAHGVHELEDGIVLGRIRKEDWLRYKPDRGWAMAVEVSDHEALGEDLFGASEAARRRAIGTLINAFVVSVDVHESAAIAAPLLRYRAGLLPEAREWLKQLQALVDRKVYRAPELVSVLTRSMDTMHAMLEATWQQPEARLPEALKPAFRPLGDDHARRRFIADWLAGLPDFQVLRLHHQWGLA